jgi:hypothetical protein
MQRVIARSGRRLHRLHTVQAFNSIPMVRQFYFHQTAETTIVGTVSVETSLSFERVWRVCERQTVLDSKQNTVVDLDLVTIVINRWVGAWWSNESRWRRENADYGRFIRGFRWSDRRTLRHYHRWAQRRTIRTIDGFDGGRRSRDRTWTTWLGDVVRRALGRSKRRPE